MKKNYFMLALASMMMAACANNDLVDEGVVKEEVPQAIGFETFANKTTRAVEPTIANLLNSYHKSFGVWAYKTTKTEAVMPNYKVAYKEDSPATWEYKDEGEQTIKYWDKKATYSFYAYAPHSNNAKLTSGVISIEQGEYAANENLQSNKDANGDEQGFSQTPNRNVFSGIGDTSDKASTDWMFATAITGYNNYAQPVPEVFSHIMSKLVVKIESTVANTVVKSVTVNGVYGTGSYNGTEWSTAGITPKNIVGLTGNIADVSKPYYSMEYLLIPSATPPTFTIEYEISGDTYKVEDTAITDITGFAKNTKYELTVTIGLSEIKFTASASDFTTPSSGSVTIN